MRVGYALLVCTVLYFFSHAKTLAATISLTSEKNALSHDEEIDINVSLSVQASDETTYYLRAVFYKPDTSNYCGYTWNGSAWFNGPYTSDEQWKNFYKISIEENTWQGSLKAKIDYNDSGCKESGEYKFKIQRFRDSGSSGFDDQNELTFSFTAPTPTFTPTPTPEPTKKPTPTKTPTPTKKPKQQTFPTAVATMTVDQSIQQTKDILGKQANTGTIENSPQIDKRSSISAKTNLLSNKKAKSTESATIDTTAFVEKSTNKGPVFIIIGAGTITGVAGIYLYQNYKKT